MGTTSVLKISVEEYLAADRVAELKSEFHDGEVFPPSAVSWKHSRVSVRLSSRLHALLEPGSCEVAISPIRVRVTPVQFVYPDIVVVCGGPAFTDEKVDTITNPIVIVEVLSPSTSDYDSGGKFRLYRQLDSLKEYVLVEQDRPRMEVFRKTPAGWMLTTYEGLDAVLQLDSVGVSIALSEVYPS
ncbi:MAG: Uma2 family endonuclease [Bryobacteraceae bacterium]